MRNFENTSFLESNDENIANPLSSPHVRKSEISNLKSAISFRPYQREIFDNHTTGIQILLWARQTGKSFTLAAWAVKRLLTRPGRLVTILSNSRSNGIELNRRCAEVCQLLHSAFEQVDLSPDNRFETFNTETRITIKGQTGRIKVLAANPRTARGFSGDLILDEFAFHEDAAAIWEAAEPILASNKDFLCRIASTPNGKHNMFYRLCTSSNIPVSRVTRTDAHLQGCTVYHPITRQPIAPAEARALAQNKRVYDQNYECQFEDQNMALLTFELISAAEREDVGVVCEGDWSEAALDRLEPGGPEERRLFAGVDVGRHHDRTVITVLEKLGSSYLVRAILRLDQMRLPDQQKKIETILRIPALKRVMIDMTGLGLGLYEYTRERFGERVQGLNFANNVPLNARLRAEGRTGESVRATEALATQLLQVFEDRALQCPVDPLLRDDLRKPERMISPSGRVSIAASRDESGHADHFWSLALAIEAAQGPIKAPPASAPVILRGRLMGRAPRKHDLRRRDPWSH
jgi:phage FluMu gp28-like protein